ncbi:methyltransferase domain-containing protein [Stemphylium lycopersici]|uniref:Methyltransferase domain-containing protein n=1 Tax=Stemphylium lycopersici TaxID=183478 RepID=A0A364MYH2_STELY|nr:methyltransferase domain-containing protein [Stemphylium lycopersici]RAQ99357.1 methyltransferase domain-containing protein [Stemphylium lycopersici]RAR07141.1 methyltransferase domain-containing protein [Stemphylium lycopersici]
MADTAAGAAVYSPLFLKHIYDYLVYTLYTPYAWQCSSKRLRAFFANHIQRATTKADFSSQGPRILDIGVGTGYFLEYAPITESTTVVLADLNTNCLDAAQLRLKKTHPKSECQTLLADFLDKGQQSVPAKLAGGGGFDAISMMLLLHCVPGPPARKMEAVVGLRQLLRPNGVLFGATILGSGAQHNLFGRFLMMWHNLQGVFSNYDDDVKSIVGALQEVFDEVKWELCGTMLLFEARKPHM